MPDAVIIEDQKSQKEVSSEKKTFFEEISKVNFYNTEWQENKDLQERQAKILEVFPDKNALINHLVQHYQHEYEREEEYAKKTHKEVRHSDPQKVIRGEIFEQLVATENGIYNLSAEAKGIQAPEKSEEALRMEATFTDFLRQPDKYGFDHLWPMRNPDLSYVETRSNELLVLTGTGEAKAAKSLDYRAYKQLRFDGLRKTLEQSMLGINELDGEEAKKRGLEGFGKDGKKLAMILHFTEHVIMCRDVKFDNPDYLIDRSGFDNASEYNDFKKMLEGNHAHSNVKLIHSSFSEDELEKIYKSVLPQFKEAIAQK